MSKSTPIASAPAWQSTTPDWLLIIRATWAPAKMRAEAAAEIMRRNAEPGRVRIELSARAERHRAMLDAALVAEDERVAA